MIYESLSSYNISKLSDSSTDAWAADGYLKRANTKIGKKCLLSYSQAEPGKELTQPRKHLLAKPCSVLIPLVFVNCVQV